MMLGGAPQKIDFKKKGKGVESEGGGVANLSTGIRVESAV
jgi:hypothetical protein